MPPTNLPGSLCALAAAASASGKLAPHSKVAGSSPQAQRTMSIWNVYQGLVESSGLTGQKGSDCETWNAVHATAIASSNWLQPSSARGLRAVRAASEPARLPMPSPTRNTARIIEKVYTVAPSISPSKRVQITSPPSAVAPEIAIVTYTGQAPAAITGAVAASVGGASFGARLAIAKLASATATLIAAAAKVAVVISKTRSR